MASAMIDTPPSAAKRELIRRFLRASKIQAEIDTGSFLDQYGAPGAPLFRNLVETQPQVAYGDAFGAPTAALRKAYQPHRQVWQDEYESHVNWEFAEDELGEIVAFLEGPAGAHFLEANWRMRAYIGTNTEHLVEEIIQHARELLSAAS